LLSVEERRGSRLDRLARVAGRGREETAPAIIGIAVIVPIAVLVAVVTAIALLIWLVLR
jgi:hypothetical protein